MSETLTGFRFIVTLDKADSQLPTRQALLVPPMLAAGFQEVSGLGAQLEVTAYPEGGENGFAHQLPLRHTWSRITLKRGMTFDPRIWLWYQAGLSQSLGARRDGAITLLADDGTPTVAWMFTGGLAAKWDGPTLNAGQGEIAIESMEIAHHGIVQVPLVPAELT